LEQRSPESPATGINLRAAPDIFDRLLTLACP
jgi:hypothetical protein